MERVPSNSSQCLGSCAEPESLSETKVAFMSCGRKEGEQGRQWDGAIQSLGRLRDRDSAGERAEEGRRRMGGGMEKDEEVLATNYRLQRLTAY